MPLVVLRPDRCNAAENYSAISWKRIPEQCWHDARARLMEHRTIFAASCLPRSALSGAWQPSIRAQRAHADLRCCCNQ